MYVNVFLFKRRETLSHIVGLNEEVIQNGIHKGGLDGILKDLDKGDM